MPDAFVPSFAIRPMGFSPGEAAVIDALLASQQSSQFRYACLHEDNLQDPDLYLVNSDNVKAMATLPDLHPSDARPALLIGAEPLMSPHAFVARPIRLPELLAALDALALKKKDALARLDASGAVMVPERRRISRVPSRLGDPDLYLRLRRPLPIGDVLVVDKNPLLADHVGKLLARRDAEVSWVNAENKAMDQCRQRQIALVIINTSTPRIDPYSLCEKIKAGIQKPMTVIFLVGRSFDYEPARARQVGCDGFLNKPLNGAHLASTLKKFLPRAA